MCAEEPATVAEFEVLEAHGDRLEAVGGTVLANGRDADGAEARFAGIVRRGGLRGAVEVAVDVGAWGFHGFGV